MVKDLFSKVEVKEFNYSHLQILTLRHQNTEMLFTSVACLTYGVFLMPRLGCLG
jgi:hypothetical protein